MYSEAAGSYDSTNRILSFNADSSVRRAAAMRVMERGPSKILDIATGTGGMAIGIAELARKEGAKVSIVGMDQNRAMLRVARAKARKMKIRNIRFELGNASRIRYHDNSFDSVCCSFSTKNFRSLDRFVKESSRVLKRGGVLVISDISRPEGALNIAMFRIYLLYMKLIGAVSNKKLYRWLPGSTNEFSRARLIKLLRENGMKDVRCREFFFGITYVISCVKAG
jgi:demethylmenaquinone methyltransferase/2-methoxy-6-polyprenyl-1,4-benzoquinol methylase